MDSSSIVRVTKSVMSEIFQEASKAFGWNQSSVAKPRRSRKKELVGGHWGTVPGVDLRTGKPNFQCRAHMKDTTLKESQDFCIP